MTACPGRTSMCSDAVERWTSHSAQSERPPAYNMKAFLVLATLAVAALGGKLPPAGTSPRQARWFLGRADNVTETVVHTKTVTVSVPSSCVVVAPSLPACRHVRQLNIAVTPPTPIAATALPRFLGDHNVVEARRRHYLEHAGVGPTGSLDAYHGDLVPMPSAQHGGWVPITGREATAPLPAVPVAPAPAPAAPAAAAAPTKELGWLEWMGLGLGLRGYTITTTRAELATATLVDANTVVTFSVRGCQPSQLPFNLNMCHTPESTASPPVLDVEVDAPAEAGPAVEEKGEALNAAAAPSAAPAAPAAPASPASPAPSP